MGLSVISPLPGAAAAVASLSGSTSVEGLPGDFAALLSGELKAFLASTSADSAKAGVGLDEDSPATTDPASANQANGIVDPALIASLMGHSGAQPAIAGQPATTIAIPEDNLARATQAITEQEKPAYDSKLAIAAENAATNTKASEKPALANAPALTNGIAQRAEAANIAVEANSAATTSSAASLMNPAAAQHVVAEASGAGKQASTTVSAHLHEPTWPQQFGEKIVWLARNDQQSAQININPPQLGPVQITVNLSGDQATLAFASPHAEVRQAIESAMPQLKEMLSTAGINLGQSNVGANMGQNNPDNPFRQGNGTRLANENAILPANDKATGASSTLALHRGRGLVDLFA